MSGASFVIPEKHVLTSEEMAFCVRAGLELGFDDDDETKHQYVHLCWPYAAYEGTLCKSDRLWFHGGFGKERTVDCAACLEELRRWMDREEDGAVAVLLTALGRLAEAAECLRTLSGVAENYLAGVEGSAEYVEAVAGGYPETTAADLRAALDAAHARHSRLAEAYGLRADAARKTP